MPDYRKIYDDVFEKDLRYNRAENSPGFRAVIKATDQLSALAGRCLDFGCGAGFVVEYLAGPDFEFRPFGVDISPIAIARAMGRLSHMQEIHERLVLIESQQLPFKDDFFGLVTCFDVLEHLDETDIETTLDELNRVLRPGGVCFGSVSCRLAGNKDLFGDNLHRSVNSVDWWIKRLEPDNVSFDSKRAQLTFWKRTQGESRTTSPVQEKAIVSQVAQSQTESVAAYEPVGAIGGGSASIGEGSVNLYQKIYDENHWYGNADEGRCPGVRLLPEYKDWLIGPVIDLGCGRGQTVESLREQGFEADGIDQIRSHPEMRVGDITEPIEGITKYKSAICIDCIEHLFELQVLALFDNMKQVERQAFSIHNGKSDGTGQELHVNRQTFHEWGKIVREHFDVAAAIKISEDQMLYLTKSK